MNKKIEIDFLIQRLTEIRNQLPSLNNTIARAAVSNIMIELVKDSDDKWYITEGILLDNKLNILFNND